MDRKKIVFVLLFLVIISVAFVVFAWMTRKQNNLGSNPPKGLSMENLVQTKNDPETFNKEFFGKIKTIGKNSLEIADDESPLKKMTKDGASPTFSLKTSDATSVVFFERGKSQEKKSLSDLRVGDDVVVEYNILTKEIAVVKVSIDGAEFKDEGNQKQPLLK